MPATEPPRAPVRPGREPPDPLGLVPATAPVEARCPVPGPMQAAAVAALGDVRDADARQDFVLDTPAAALDRHGVVVRLRRGGGGDATAVTVRPLLLGAVGPEIAAAPGFALAVEASGGGRVCSGSLVAPAPPGRVVDVLHGHCPPSRLLTRAQRAFLAAHALAGGALDDLVVSGPVLVLVLAFAPAGMDREVRAEVCLHADGRRTMALTVACTAATAADAVARTAALLARAGPQGAARGAGSSAGAGSGCAPSSLNVTSISCRGS
jgi:hypothetical protein